MNNQTPKLLPLYREDEDGTDDQLTGWAMVLPETEKVVAYVCDSTGVGTGSVNAFASLRSACRILSYRGIYPVPDIARLPGDLPAPR
ncbi:MAG: hypothetical protein ACRDRS_07815 [Pseudonocardiaceae bacterium]